MKGFLVFAVCASIGAVGFWAYEHPKDAEVQARKGAAAAGSAAVVVGQKVSEAASSGSK